MRSMSVIGLWQFGNVRDDLQTVQPVLQVKHKQQGVVLVETFEWHG